MEKVTFDVPTLWADHHVLKVRDALTPLKGVEDVYASAAWKQVLVSYDPAKTKPEALEKALADAGYPVGEGEAVVLATATENRQDPRWKKADAPRLVTTTQADLEMSGEFRRY